MFTHKQIWSAIDACAARNGWSTSRLGVEAGLHPTALNISKRKKGEKLHWPSTETLSAILKVADVTPAEFATYLADQCSIGNLSKAAAGHEHQLMYEGLTIRFGHLSDVSFPSCDNVSEISIRSGRIDPGSDTRRDLYRDRICIVFAFHK